MNAVLQGFVAAGAGPKKTHPSCPMCKRDYAAIRRPAFPLSSNSSAAVSAAIAAMAAGPGSFESIPIQSILPPPSQFHRPALSLEHTAYAHNEHFRMAAEAALQFANRTAPGLRTELLADLLDKHPRVNALLTAYPPFRDCLRQVRRDLIAQVLSARAAWLRRTGAAESAERQRQRQRQQMLAMDHGDGVEPVPLMSDANAASFLLNRASPYGPSSVLALAFGSDAPAPAPNPILQLYRESRYQGAMTHALGRMRLWSDLNLAHVPAQPDVIWALRQSDVGTGRTPFAQDQPAAAAAAAGAVPPAFAAAATAAAAASSSSSTAPLPSLSSWLNTELTSLLSTRHQSHTPDQHEHFLVSLVLSYLELLLSKLELEEKEGVQRASQRKRRREEQRRAQGNAAAAQSSPSPLPHASASSSSAAAAASSSSSFSSSVPPLSSSFVPSYRSGSSSLHPVPLDAPTQLPALERVGADPDGDVVVVSERRNQPRAAAPTPRRSPSAEEIIDLDADEDVPSSSGGGNGDVSLLRASSSTGSSGGGSSVPSHLPGGHLHSLFALSAPLGSSVDFLFHKLEEFLRGLTGVFVHRLLLFVLARAYTRPGAGPSAGDPRAPPNADAERVRAAIEGNMLAALQSARDRWRAASGLHVSAGSASPPRSRSASTAAVATESSPSAATAASAAAGASSSRAARKSQKRRARAAAATTAANEESGERKEGEAAGASSAGRAAGRSRPVASGFMAAVFGAAPSGSSMATNAHSGSPAAISLSPSLDHPSSLAAPSAAAAAVSAAHARVAAAAHGDEGFASSSPSDGSGAAAAAAAAIGVPVPPPAWSDPALAAAERRFTEEDDLFISGVRSSKRPRPAQQT